MDEKTKRELDDIVKNKLPGFIQMLEQNLDFNRWRFTRVFSGVGQFSPIVVYEAEVCRVMFVWRPPTHLHDETLTMDVRYGRSHAPNDKEIIIWNGQKYYCWHDIRKVLFFLDGLSPIQATSDPFLWPKVMEQFRTASVKKGWTQPEHMARMHAVIWKNYGQRLFELFDLRKPDLWAKYSDFLKEYYMHEEEQARRKGLVSAISNPPLYQVC